MKACATVGGMDRPVFVQRYRWTACRAIGWQAELVAVVVRTSTVWFLLTLAWLTLNENCRFWACGMFPRIFHIFYSLQCLRDGSSNNYSNFLHMSTYIFLEFLHIYKMKLPKKKTSHISKWQIIVHHILQINETKIHLQNSMMAYVATEGISAPS